MKYFVTFIFVFSVIFYSCSDDNTSNNSGTGGEVVLISLDSLSITLTTMFGIIDSNFIINNAPNIKITFNCSTNADSVNSFAQYRIIIQDSNSVLVDTTNNWISLLNNAFSLNVNASNFYFFKFYLQISGNSPYFIRLKNVRVVKLT